MFLSYYPSQALDLFSILLSHPFEGLDNQIPTVRPKTKSEGKAGKGKLKTFMELNETHAIGNGNTKGNPQTQFDAQNVEATSNEGGSYTEFVGVQNNGEDEDRYDEGHYLKPLPQKHLISSEAAQDESDQLSERNAAVNSAFESSTDLDHESYYQRHLPKASTAKIPSGPYGNRIYVTEAAGSLTISVVKFFLF